MKTGMDFLFVIVRIQERPPRRVGILVSEPRVKPLGVLVKLGWTVLRIPAWRCHEEIGSVIDEIRKMQDQLLD